MQNKYFYKILEYFHKRKSENRDLKHVTLLFREAELSYIH